MTKALIILTEDELIDFAVRVARVMIVSAGQPTTMPFFGKHMGHGAVSERTAKRAVRAIMNELEKPLADDDSPKWVEN